MFVRGIKYGIRERISSNESRIRGKHDFSLVLDSEKIIILLMNIPIYVYSYG